MEEILVAFLSMFLLVALIPLYLWKRRQISSSPDQRREEDQGFDVIFHLPINGLLSSETYLTNQVSGSEGETVIRHSGARRMRRRPAAASTSAAPVATAEEIVEGSDEDVPEDDMIVAKVPKKKEKRRQEWDAQRQADEAARESRQAKQDRYADMRRRKDEEREAQEHLLEEEANARKAKEEEASALEFEKWKGEFSIEEEGATESEIQDGSQGLLFNFVEYIKRHKCVPLEDLAAEFKLQTQDCIKHESPTFYCKYLLLFLSSAAIICPSAFIAFNVVNNKPHLSLPSQICGLVHDLTLCFKIFLCNSVPRVVEAIEAAHHISR